jgi:hypothetical protein
MPKSPVIVALVLIALSAIVPALAAPAASAARPSVSAQQCKDGHGRVDNKSGFKACIGGKYDGARIR